MVFVDGKSPGSRKPIFAPFGFEPDEDSDGSSPFRVRHLLAKLVFESVRDFRLREDENRLRALTPAEIEKGLLKGKFGTAREEVQEVDLASATGQALQAFEDGLYLLFVDDEQKLDLEDPVFLQPGTRVTVIRLVALAGR